MSELQNDNVEPVIDNPTKIENQDGAELAPASEAQHEEQAQVETVNQDAINKAINKKHFEAKQAERERDEALAKVAEFEKKQQEQLAAQVGDIPPMPDAFDDDFDAKVKARDDALLRKAEFDAQQNLYLQQQQFQQQQEQQRRAEEVQKQAANYTDKAKEYGISNEELNKAGNLVASYGVSDDLTMAILSDSEGPLITQYLAANPMEISALNSGNPYIAGAKLAEIKIKASALKPRTSNAPEPATKVQGSSVDADANQYQHIKGAKFE